MELKNLESVFVDENVNVISSLVTVFTKIPKNCIFKIGNILDQGPGVLVSPSNCYGNMDGGIDLDYRNFLGDSIEFLIKKYINDFHGGKLEFGRAQIIPTKNILFPEIVFCPTVELPGSLASKETVSNAIYALYKEIAIFNDSLEENSSKKIKKLLIPGFGTGFGGLDPLESAVSMKEGYLKALSEFYKY